MRIRSILYGTKGAKKEEGNLETQLSFLKQLAHGLAVQFGSSCEIVIHDLRKKDLENSIVHIENGHISDRCIGDGPSEIVLESLSHAPTEISDKLSYLTKTKDGRILKSSTLYIRNDTGGIDFIFSINYDITSLLAVEQGIHTMLHIDQKPSSDPSEGETEEPTKITHNVNELLDILIEQAVAKVGKPVTLMNKEDKVEVVQYLKDAGAFLITKSGDKVSSLLGISKFTLYSYMDK